MSRGSSNLTLSMSVALLKLLKFGSNFHIQIYFRWQNGIIDENTGCFVITQISIAMQTSAVNAHLVHDDEKFELPEKGGFC